MSKNAFLQDTRNALAEMTLNGASACTENQKMMEIADACQGVMIAPLSPEPQAQLEGIPLVQKSKRPADWEHYPCGIDM